MRILLILAVIVVAALVAAGWWRYSSHFPSPSRESVQLNSDIRDALVRLRDEEKFEPHGYPPLGYTGVATPEDGVVARTAVNDVIAAVLARQDGAITAGFVTDLIGQAMKQVRLLETEDRDRTAGYLIEIWYLLGFKGATGRFAHGSAYPLPEGYGEPLPPGWKSPTEPRPTSQP